MANEEHLKIIKQGVKAWNQWRADNRGITPDLSNAILENADLSDANLSDADLSYTNLSYTDLSETNLSDADLSYADLSRAKLISAKLISAKLSYADLSRARLKYADLSYAYLLSANLYLANLDGAKLYRADLSNANLVKADLATAQLIYTKLNGANLTGATLWEIQRAGWSIKGVICEYIYWHSESYWDYSEDIKTEYAPGEFERLFAEQTKILLFYEDGIKPLEIATLPVLIQHLEEMQGCALRFANMHEDSGGAVVELAIENKDNQSLEQVKQLQAALQVEAQQRAQYQRLALTEWEVCLQLQSALEELRRVFSEFIAHQKPTYLLNSQRDIHMSDNKRDTYNISGQAGAVGPNAHAHDMTFNQTVNNAGESLDLVALSAELAQLRLAIAAIAAKPDSSPQAAIALGRVAEAEIAAGENNRSKVLEHLKAAGKWTLDFAKEVGKDVVAEAIKQSMGMP